MAYGPLSPMAASAYLSDNPYTVEKLQAFGYHLHRESIVVNLTSTQAQAHCDPACAKLLDWACEKEPAVRQEF